MSVPFPPEGVKVFSVGELTRALKGMIEEAHPEVWVEGEVSNLARPGSGHVYLTLKDEEAPLRAVVYREVALRMRFDLRDGMRVIARGRLTVYTPRGEYQLLVEEVQPKGVGPLELAFRQLKEKLFVRGFFDPARKKPLPRFPRRIALVTSPTGSAVRDVLEVLARRWPALEVWVCPVRVQGDGAAQEVAAAIALLNHVAGPGTPQPADALVLARGGGSLEDLWAFNEECVAEATFASRIPVVTGVGHEDDLTIADLVADVRALTPSESAERVAPDSGEVQCALDELRGKLRLLLAHSVEGARARLEQLAARPCLRRPLERLRDAERRVDELGERLRRGARQGVRGARERLDARAARLESLSPLNVLARGYSLTRRLEDHSLVRRAGQVARGDWIVTELPDGRLVSRVEVVTARGGVQAPGGRAPGVQPVNSVDGPGS